MTTISHFLASENRSSFLIGKAVRETEKAIAFAVDGDKRVAWFPKSKSTLLVDDYYAEKVNKWIVPMWIAQSRANELGVLVWHIGG